MTPTERRTGCIQALAQIDQTVAEVEELLTAPVLADDEREYLLIQLKFRRQWRERFEKMLADLEAK